MALTRGEAQITWPTGAASITLSAATRADSEVVALNAADVQAAVQVRAFYDGTATASDYLDVWIKYTAGDLLGDSGDDYDASETALYLGRLNLYAPGVNPAVATFEIPCSPKAFMLSVAGPGAATHNLVVRARLAYQRS
jgi:hypothetical protein